MFFSSRRKWLAVIVTIFVSSWAWSADSTTPGGTQENEKNDSTEKKAADVKAVSQSSGKARKRKQKYGGLSILTGVPDSSTTPQNGVPGAR